MERDAQVSGQALARLHRCTLCTAASIEQVQFVANQYAVNASVEILEIESPPPGIFKSLGVGKIVDKQNAMSPVVVIFGDRPESLLSSGIPQLDAHRLPVDFGALHFEVHANRGDELLGKAVLRVSQ